MRFMEIDKDLRNEIYADYKDEGIDRITTYKEVARVDFFLEPVKVGEGKWKYGVLNKEDSNLNEDLWFVKELNGKDGKFGFC